MTIVGADMMPQSQANRNRESAAILKECAKEGQKQARKLQTTLNTAHEKLGI